MAADYQAHKVTAGQGNEHEPVNDLLAAIEDSFNNIGDTAYMQFAAGLIFDLAKVTQNGAASGDWFEWSTGSGIWVNGTPSATTMTVISDSTLTAQAANFDFTSISASYKHLMLVMYLRSDRASTNDDLGVRFNNDTANNYDGYIYRASGTTPTEDAAENIGASSMQIEQVLTGATATVGSYSAGVMYIPHYAGAANNKIMQMQAALKLTTATGGLFTVRGMGAWRANTAISRITLMPLLGTHFKEGSRVTLIAF